MVIHHGFRPYRCPAPIGYFADPQDCGKFYHCVRDRPHHMTCAAGTEFDVTLKVCNWPELAGCVPRQASDEPAELTDFTCPEASGRFRDPLDCTSYYECDRQVALRMPCEPGTLFDDSLGECNWEEAVSCSSMAGRGAGEAAGFSLPAVRRLLFPRRADCNKFYQCDDGRGRHMECATGTEFDPVLKICNWPECASTA
ncbi:PREDICTED: peritrophin-1-like [Priapulus caudatus]|uniref:Peritrophin-1-like n=1 Tax=Priapulus caudatus TaxID=37621 RepID=A0ABM1ES36_PRICU|nr:PREDICTED: peritrophin-1-like [Priapulus caudatus]